MIRSIQHDRMVETLLNALETERYVRRPLLLEIIGELSTSQQFEPARGSARRLLERLETGDVTQAELGRAIAELRQLAREAAADGRRGDGVRDNKKRS
jgi:hypothetical protein